MYAITPFMTVSQLAFPHIVTCQRAAVTPKQNRHSLRQEEEQNAIYAFLKPTPGGPMIVPVQYLIIISSESLRP